MTTIVEAIALRDTALVAIQDHADALTVLELARAHPEGDRLALGLTALIESREADARDACDAAYNAAVSVAGFGSGVFEYEGPGGADWLYRECSALIDTAVDNKKRHDEEVRDTVELMRTLPPDVVMRGLREAGVVGADGKVNRGEDGEIIMAPAEGIDDRP